MLTRYPSLDVFLYFSAIVIPLFAPSALRYMLPITLAPGYVQMVGMITAGLLMGLFIAVGFVHTVYLFLATLYMSFLLASQITLPGTSLTHRQTIVAYLAFCGRYTPKGYTTIARGRMGCLGPCVPPLLPPHSWHHLRCSEDHIPTKRSRRLWDCRLIIHRLPPSCVQGRYLYGYC